MGRHTQTAVNNFLGIHRYDAVFQIKVGSWARTKNRYAYGNVLWKHLTETADIVKHRMGSDYSRTIRGISWHSGAYGRKHQNTFSGTGRSMSTQVIRSS